MVTRQLAAGCARNLQEPVAPARNNSDTRPAAVADGMRFVGTELPLLLKLTFFLDGKESSTVILILAIVRVRAAEASCTTRVEEGIIPVEVVVLLLLLVVVVTVVLTAAAALPLVRTMVAVGRPRPMITTTNSMVRRYSKCSWRCSSSEVLFDIR
jgi:hypothetical protein